ncbi:hypothetical protein LINPERPRIM_LOCUS33397 [Linum perenne]
MWLSLLQLPIFRIIHKRFLALKLRRYCQEIGVAH